MSLEFLLTAFVVVLLPGTGVIYTLAIGLGRGFRASVAASFGCTLGIVPAAIASIVGLAALLHTSALAFMVLKYLGVAYLFYMAWKILRDDSVMEVSEDGEKRSMTRIAFTGTLLNVLNPKLSLFFLAFLPKFVSAETANPTAHLIALAGVFMAYSAFAAAARDYVIQRPKVMQWIKRTFAGAFGFLGARVALSD